MDCITSKTNGKSMNKTQIFVDKQKKEERRFAPTQNTRIEVRSMQGKIKLPKKKQKKKSC